MATTVSFSASMRTRKTNDSSNYKASAASQEFYTSGTNFVGIVHFSGLSLLNKIITGMTLRVTSAEAGYGAGTTKTVYLRKSKYQAASQSGVTGGNYYGDALGTFTGSFYGNTTSYDFSGALFDSLAAYLQAGNNTICIYSPSPQASSQGYSRNYLQWSAATLFVTYEEGVSQPRVSAPSVDMGAAVTVYTDRLSTAATHTLSYSFAGASGQIASGVGDSVSWTPPLALAQRVPSATSGLCTITCDTYYAGVLTGTKTCTVTLTVPGSVVPSISGVSYAEAVSGIAAQFAGYVQNKSKLAVSVTASGAQGSTVTAYRATLGGNTYTASSFTTGILSVAGDNTLTVTVTDSRGRTATTTRTISVLSYAPPTLSLFKAERCNSAGSAPQTDGNRVRISATAGASSVGGKNTMTCTVFYKLSNASAWTQAATITPSNYAIASTNLLLSQTFDVLSSFDLMLRVSDYFQTVEQSVGIGTKQVMLDFFRNGTGIAFGKVAETAGVIATGWPVVMDAALSVAASGTGVTPRSRTVDNLLFLGTNLSFADTTANWSQQGFGWAWYSQATVSSVTDKPAQYGFLLNIPLTGSSEAHQLYFVQNNGAIYHRGGNGSGWGGSWKVLYDQATVIPVTAGGTGQTSAAGARNTLGLGNTTGPVPVANGGTGANNAKTALNNLGIFYSATLPASGTDGQVCLVPVG